MAKLLTGGFLLLGFFLSVQAQAFQLGDHGRITRLAFREALSCFPELAESFPRFRQESVLAGVLQEDLNIIRKWYRYSHYYNPYKKLDMRRDDAEASVHDAAVELSSKGTVLLSEKSYLLLGRAIHYIQDVAVPPHVIPVEHGLTDGFESYSVPPLRPNTDCLWVMSSDWNDPLALETALKENAVMTYDRVMREKLPYFRGGKSLEDSWAALFWTPGANFGSYGTFGNRYGKTRFSVSGETIAVDQSVYDRFKQEQLRIAVDATRKALIWFDRLLRSR